MVYTGRSSCSSRGCLNQFIHPILFSVSLKKLQHFYGAMHLQITQISLLKQHTSLFNSRIYL